VADEPYNLEMQPLEHPHAADCQVFLTADPDTVAEGCNVRPANPLSIANNADALRTRSQTLGYTRDWGELGGGVTYIALGHCHSAGTNNQTAFDENMGTGGKVLQNFFGQWQLNPAFERLMKNCLEWGTSAPRVAVDAIEGEYNPYSALPSVDKEGKPLQFIMSKM